jgi:hypothetical protein
MSLCARGRNNDSNVPTGGRGRPLPRAHALLPEAQPHTEAVGLSNDHGDVGQLDLPPGFGRPNCAKLQFSSVRAMLFGALRRLNLRA